MTIRVVYKSEPLFPATDQHPAAQRVQVNGFWVDYVGQAPTVQETQDFIDSPAAKAQRQQDAVYAADVGQVALLALLKTATPAEIEAYIETNAATLPNIRAFLKDFVKVVALMARL